MNKVVLAFNGSIETSLCIHVLKKNYGAVVIAFCANIGQDEYLEPIGEQAVDLGADATYVSDLRERFTMEFIIPSFKAGARYQSGYLLSSALSRPLLVSELVRLAREEDAEAIAIGSTGLGNERARFEACLKSLAPDIKLIAPLEESGITSHAAICETARQAGIPFEVTRRFVYNIERNVWGASIDFTCGGDFFREPQEGIYVLTRNPTYAPDVPDTITIGFDAGVFDSVDGERYKPIRIIELLNRIGGKHGIGRMDVVEQRLSGRLTREIYEAPAATILYTAYAALEQLVLAPEMIQTIQTLSRIYADIIYHGQWFSSHREALDAFFDKAREHLTGTVRMRLFKGVATPIGRSSPFALSSDRTKHVREPV